MAQVTEQEQKSNEAYEAEMTELNTRIITLKNIDNKPFEHSYNGVPVRLEPGQERHFAYHQGHVLAKHLAMKMERNLAKKENRLGTPQTGGKAYSEKNVRAFIDRIIIGEEGSPAPVPAETPEQRAQKRAEEMDKSDLPDVPKVKKKDVVDELKSRGISFDPKAPIEELQQLIIEDEARG